MGASPVRETRRFIRPRSPSSLLDPLRLVDLRLVGRLRLLQAGSRVGEDLVALLVFLGLLAGDLGVLLRDRGFAHRALLRELLGGAAIDLGLPVGGLLLLGLTLLVERALARGGGRSLLLLFLL